MPPPPDASGESARAGPYKVEHSEDAGWHVRAFDLIYHTWKVPDGEKHARNLADALNKAFAAGRSASNKEVVASIDIATVAIAAQSSAQAELLRVRTTQATAAHILDNIGIEMGLGANATPLAVQEAVRAGRAEAEGKAVDALESIQYHGTDLPAVLAPTDDFQDGYRKGVNSCARIATDAIAAIRSKL